MLTIKPELQRVNPLPLHRTNPRHLDLNSDINGTVGFSGSYSHGGILSDITPKNKGAAIIEQGTKIGAGAVLRDGSLGAAGINRTDGSSFANAMLSAIDGVSAQQNRASQLTEKFIIDPESVDVQDITLAQAEASMSLDLARTLLTRLTQAWRDLVNTR